MKAAKVLGFSEDINSGRSIPKEARKSQNGGSPPTAAGSAPYTPTVRKPNAASVPTSTPTSCALSGGCVWFISLPNP